MMRKQNVNPNRNDSFNNKSIHAKSHHQHPTSTPDPSTSRLNYKPKFIKKHINIHQDVLTQAAHTTPNDSSHHSRTTYLHSPNSATQQHSVDIASFPIQSNWKDLYQITKREMEARTQRFDKAINIFCFILKDMKRIMVNPNLSEEDRLNLSEGKIDSLLEAFGQFECSN